MSRWRCSSLSICVHVHVFLCVCIDINLYNHVLNLFFALSISYSLLSSFLVMYPACHCAMLQPLFTEISEPEINLNITGSNSSTSPSHTLPPLSPPTHPILSSFGQGDLAGDPCVIPPTLRRQKHYLIPFYLPPFAHTHTYTHTTPQPDIPVLSQLASGCRAREQEAPPLGQLFQTPLPPWAPHSLIQGSFVVLTSWNS